MIFSPPTDRLDRRRRIYRWKKRHPKRAFRRGTLLHADGSVPTMSELLAWKARATAKIMDANLKGRLFDDVP